MLRALCITLGLSVAACGFGNDVGQTGGYEIARAARVTDSALYPLESFVVLEQDMRTQQLRIFCFTGDLRRADVGLEDLRRIALRFGGFAMAFDAPQERVTLA